MIHEPPTTIGIPVPPAVAWDAPRPVARQALRFLLVGMTALLLAIVILAVRRPWSAEDLPRRALGWRINPQHEDAATLQLLPGIGAALAHRIVDHRQRHPLHSLADLETIPGIGPRTTAKVAPYLTFDPVE